MHYVANTVYYAGDKDCWGLRKGEFRPFTDKETGLPKWQLKPATPYIASATEPLPVRWEPWGRTGEGGEPDLEAARHCAIWPEATDAELTGPGLAERLEARLPALLAEFQRAVESLGLVY
jgi:hypothetical protein